MAAAGHSAGREAERDALAALDPAALARDAGALVQVPSLTGDERAALERLGELAAGHGLDVELYEHDLDPLREAPGFPGSEAPREELLGLSATLPGPAAGSPRLCLNGHLDVISPGNDPWRLDPWSGAVEAGRLHGRGSVDMKGAVAAALHALAAVRAAQGTAPACEAVLLAVASEEDGGLGSFAALERDSAYAACLIPEPTGFDVVCAQAGALTFEGTLRGRSAHAASRLAGISAIDRYLPLHAAVAQHERRLNAAVEHELMSRLDLPYPILVGRIEAGEWSSQVPDRLRFEGRLGVPVGQPVEQARAELEAALAATTDEDGPPLELTWRGGQFAPAETDPNHPFAVLVREALAEELGRPVQSAGVAYGADMRLFCERGIPTVMAGTPGLERAHATDEYAVVEELAQLARAIVRLVMRFSGPGEGG